jgi:Flp pilus assembly protein TadG
MKRTVQFRRGERARSGKTLATFVISVPVLLGMVGLTLDGGMLMATQREVQNAADAAALAAAMDLYRGASASTAQSTGKDYVTNSKYENLSKATPTVNVPPTAGAYKNNTNFAEANVSMPLTMTFMHILGMKTQTVSARAVAGYEPIAAGEGAIVLRTDTQPGIALNGNNTRLIVNGGITVNSLGGGVDQYGQTVSSALGGYAMRTQTSVQSPAPVVAVAIQVAGGIDTIDNFRAYDSSFTNLYDPSNTDRPVFADLKTAAPDPLQSLPTPSTSNGVVQTYPQYQGNGNWTTAASPQKITIGNKDTVTFSPGIYQQVIINGGNVTFNPGIYVLGPGLGNGTGQQTLSISNGATVNGSGVMFYNTGSDYQSNGTPDSSDGSTLGTDSNAHFGSIAVNGGTINLTPIASSSSPFFGILFYQRRWNTQDLGVGGNSNTVNLTGTVYDKWGNLTLAGQGKYNAEFVVGTMSISGNAAVTINATGKNQGRVNQVFLVE